MGWVKRVVLPSGSAALVAVLLSAHFTSAVDAAVEPQPTCDAWRVEYALAANLKLTNTPHGAGNGTYTVGPGRAVILFEEHQGEPHRHAELLGYSMQEQFTMKPSSIFGSATIIADLTTETAEGCGVAFGVVSGNELSWTSPIHGYRSDGTIHCEGGLCGKFEAPPPGESGFSLPPQDVQFGPFTFGPDGSTVHDGSSTFVEKSELPKQTAYIALSGREVRRVCVQANSCRR